MGFPEPQRSQCTAVPAHSLGRGGRASGQHFEVPGGQPNSNPTSPVLLGTYFTLVTSGFRIHKMGVFPELSSEGHGED